MNGAFIVVAQILLICQGSSSKKDVPTLNGGIDRHAVFNQPLTHGVYNFTSQGFIPTEPLVRIRKIHKDMIHVIQGIQDHKKIVSYLLTLSNTAHEDMKKLREKIEEAGDITKESNWRRSVKADVFILLTSHAALVSNVALYFPDVMSIIMKKNPEFAQNVRWIIELSADLNIINDSALVKLFHLAKQELGIIPKEADYENPYKGQNVVVDQPSTTTKKPRKKLQRGPRMSGSEL